jgi:hypothetical protein
MKRNMDSIRLLLIRSEGNKAADSLIKREFTVPEIAYHVQLLIDAGLVEGRALTDEVGTFNGSIVSRLTWAGHDFLDAMRDDTVWKKAKERVLKPGASWTFDILKEWLKAEAKSKLGLPL